MSHPTLDLSFLAEKLSQIDGFEPLEKWFQECSSRGIETFLVGGCIRDSALHISKKNLDLDFIIKPFEKTKEATILFNTILRGHFFPLDEQRKIFRIHANSMQLDLNGIRGDELIDDMFQRDFSMNAIYTPLSTFLQQAQIHPSRVSVVDFFNGISDLTYRNIRAHNPSTFKEDPLRILRAFRIASQIQGTIDPDTYQEMVETKHEIKKCAQERIREEFVKILAQPKSHQWVFAMEETGILSTFFPFFDWYTEIDNCFTSWLQLQKHVKAGLQYLEEIFVRIHQNDFPFSEKLQYVLDTQLQPETTFEVAMKIAILLHDIGKPDTLRVVKDRLRFFEHENVGVKVAKEYLQEMHFSTKEIRFISELIQWHMRPHNLSNVDNLTQRARYRFFRDTSPYSIPILLIALADAYATRMVPMKELPHYEDFLHDMLQYAFTPGTTNQIPFLNGNEIMEVTGLPPGKNIGYLQSKLLEEQSVGNVQSKENAIEWVKEFEKVLDK
ncbi:MAG TPA: HD domain-containing protein [Caldisericia bacterium]|nr:HD domain-containing protein [Caldisericia bacterium]